MKKENKTSEKIKNFSYGGGKLNYPSASNYITESNIILSPNLQ